MTNKIEAVLSVMMAGGVAGLFLAGMSGFTPALIASGLSFAVGGIGLFGYYVIQELLPQKTQKPDIKLVINHQA